MDTKRLSQYAATFQGAPATSSSIKRATPPELLLQTPPRQDATCILMQEGVCAQPRSQRSALPVSMEPSWCAPATPPLISLSHPSSSPEYTVRSPRKVSHCNDDFSRREAGRQQGEEVSCVRHCAWEPGARLAHHNEKLESFPLEGAALISPASLPIPAKSDGCPDGVKKAFRQSVWRACFKSSAIDAVARGREKGLSAKSRN